MPSVTTARAACATIVLGATVVGVAWLATYRVEVLVANRRRSDDLPYPITFFREDAPAWWGAYAATILLLLGVGFALRVLHRRLRPAQRTSQLLLLQVRDLVRPSLRRLRRDLLGGLAWLVVEPLRLLVKR
jgi:lysylphosphatidylglycerol synthetase-like protein (DUF2156 family)